MRERIDRDRLRRGLTIGLTVLVVVSLIGVVYMASTDQERTGPYTEFYLLDSEGNTADYPDDLSSGETATVIAGIGNYEHETTTYTVAFVLEERTVTVDNRETWEEEMSFAIDDPGEHEVEVLLFLGEDVEGEPYRDLTLQVTVEEGG